MSGPVAGGPTRTNRHRSRDYRVKRALASGGVSGLPAQPHSQTTSNITESPTGRDRCGLRLQTEKGVTGIPATPGSWLHSDARLFAGGPSGHLHSGKHVVQSMSGSVQSTLDRTDRAVERNTHLLERLTIEVEGH